MDRTLGNRPLALALEEAAGGSDPFKDRLAREGKKRAERRDPRIQPPTAGPSAPAGPAIEAAPSPEALTIVGRAATKAEARETRSGPFGFGSPRPKPAKPQKPSAPRPSAAPVAPVAVAPVATAGAGPGSGPAPIIPPGEVYADPMLTELVQQRDGSFVMTRDRSRRPDSLLPLSGVVAPGAALRPAGSPAERLSIKALSPSGVSSAPSTQPTRAVATLPDDRQDDVAAGAMAAVFLLIAGWMGFQVLGNPRTPAPAPAADQGALAMVAAAPAVAAPVADPTAGAPLDLTPATPVAPGPGAIATPSAAMAAQSMPMSPVLFASYSVPTALAAATAIAAPASEATPVLPVSCDPNLVMRTYFCTAQASLTVSARAMIERDLAQLRGCADGREIVVTGYADTRGMAARNAALSEGRAESVASFLRSQGLAVVTVAGAGETAGLEDDRNCAQQRRVDISFKGSAPPQSLSCSAPAAAAAMTCT